MKKIKFGADIVLAGAIVCPITAIVLSVIFDELIFSKTEGVIHYTWIFVVCLPIEIASFVLGINLKKKGMKYRLHFIVPTVVILLSVIVGYCRFLVTEIYHFDSYYVTFAQEEIGFSFPENIKVLTSKSISPKDSDGIISDMRIVSKKDRLQFQQKIQNSPKWTDHLGTTLEKSLPIVMSTIHLSEFDYFLYYNASTKEFNTYPLEKGTYDCIFLAYNCSDGQLILLSDYRLIVD